MRTVQVHHDALAGDDTPPNARIVRTVRAAAVIRLQFMATIARVKLYTRYFASVFGKAEGPPAKNIPQSGYLTVDALTLTRNNSILSTVRVSPRVWYPYTRSSIAALVQASGVQNKSIEGKNIRTP